MGKAVLSGKYEPIGFGRNLELIDSFLSFELSRKALLMRSLPSMDSLAIDETHYLRTELVGSLEQYIRESNLDLLRDVLYSKLSFETILWTVGVSIPDDYESNLERRQDYMELSRELELNRLFIPVNRRSYYSDEEVQAFFAFVISR